MKRLIIILILVFLAADALLLYWILSGVQPKNLSKKIAESTSIFRRGNVEPFPDDETPKAKTTVATLDKTFPDSLKLIRSEKIILPSAPKSLIINKLQNLLYAANLEGMCVTEIDRQTRKVVRRIDFDRTASKGYDYTDHKWHNSFEEKPVETCLTHNDRFLWISLHNAGGIVVWDLEQDSTFSQAKDYKKVALTQNDKKQKIKLLFIPTGKTPKVIATSPDGKYLFVSNWHSNTVSVINIEGLDYTKWLKVKDLPTLPTPRGLYVSTDAQQLFVAHMGANSVGIYQTDNLTKKENITIGYTPRHLLGNQEFMYVSLSSPEQLVKISNATKKIVRTAKTCDDPRTIAFSADSTMIFATCYAGESLQAFRSDNLLELGLWESKGSPVGVATAQVSDTVEVWVCNYSYSTAKIFSFRKIVKEKATFGK